MTEGISNYFSGLSGLQLPIPKYLYPDDHKGSSRLTYYSTFFNSIEINSTFYKLPLAATFSKWSSQVPPDFKFTLKLWRDITHVKLLNFKESDVERFFKIASHIKNKGCILIQFPPSLSKVNFLQLHQLLNCVDQYNFDNEWKIAVEFRNKVWYDGDVYDLLKSYEVSLIVQDIPKSSTPMIEHSSKIIYLRFHGPTGNYRESYSDSFLYEYSLYIKDWLKEGKTVYVYFNNTMGDAFRNLERLNKYVLNPD